MFMHHQPIESPLNVSDDWNECFPVDMYLLDSGVYKKVHLSQLVMSVTRERTRVAVWEFVEQVLRQSAASASEMFKFHILNSYQIRQLTTFSYKFTFQTFHFQFSDTWGTWVAWDKYLASESERNSEHFMLEDSSNLEKGESIKTLGE